MRRCVAVLGPGRSGTSITMKLLEAAGLRLSTALVPASEENPDGHFEDMGIRDSQQRLLRSLRLSPYLPRPAAWTGESAYEEIRRELTAIVTEEVGQSDELWGFKDPRTSVLWPLWQEVFFTAHVTPTVLFCVRDGHEVVRSMMKTYDLSQDVAEGIYFYRTFHALDDVSEGWFFVQYRDWFEDPVAQLQSLASHCGLHGDEANYNLMVAAAVRPELDRHGPGDRLEVAGAIEEIDGVLASFSGTSYDQQAIDAWCRSVEDRLGHLSFILAGIRRMSPQPETATRLRKAVRRRLGGRWR